MSVLSKPLRGLLEKAIKEARQVAERGARKALEALAVHEPEPYQYMDEPQRSLRRKLRAQARQLGDSESQVRRGAYDIKHLVEKLAYDQWHRLLFARFLLENNLLISPDYGVSVSLEDCEELAPSLGLKDAWTVAARFAAKELPEIFRADDPAGAVELPFEDRKPLIQLVTDLQTEIFTAKDSLGWCYQYWQAERKKEVNASDDKIGAYELPPVTQLFTEDYMVDFLLDNTLGAWHAGKLFLDNPALAETAQSEEELRSAVALPGCPWKYLRLIRGDNGRWKPAAGTFGDWPASACQIRCLDPCMGSGHFVVAMFERLVALRMIEDDLEEVAAVSAVISDNLFGLEIDPRCTQIGAFNLALAAWRRVGHCKLPVMNLACSGLAPNTREVDWLAIASDNFQLENGMKRLYRLFQDAPVLGSLINPRAQKGDLLAAEFDELRPLLQTAMAKGNKDDSQQELAVTACGLARAAEILAGQFTLVATNVPYVGEKKQHEILRRYCQHVHRLAKADLATCFIERCLAFCELGGTTCLVTPQNWLFLKSYSSLRRRLLASSTWNFLGRLGPKGFQTSMWDFNIVLLGLSNGRPLGEHSFYGIDVSSESTPAGKAARLCVLELQSAEQSGLVANPDARIGFVSETRLPRLSIYANCLAGIMNGDTPRFIRNFWEFNVRDPAWTYLQSTVSDGTVIGGLESVIFFDEVNGHLREEASVRRAKLHNADERGNAVWGRHGVAVSQMSSLPVSRYFGNKYDSNVATIVPHDSSNLPAIWAFCNSQEFVEEVRALDQKLNVTNATFGKVPFDLFHWQRVAAEKFPDGLPKPYSNDPSQWLFDGHPAGSVQSLHVAVARLLGYQWPRQTGCSFPDCPALGPDGLEQFSDDDGIVCLYATKGEAPAAERLRGLVVKALGNFDLSALINSAGPKGSKSDTLEEWLRDEFFEQHCALFHNRPFIWHIWDGHKTGFSALVNYHRLTHANLEKLTYTYLGDWIRRQQVAVGAGEGGSDARLQAARHLQERLKLILEGEPPYDIFVRWKPLSKQAVGWQPDLNDGVRLNIRPFLAEDIPGGKKGAGLLRAKPNIKWEKDRGKEPVRNKTDFPWFWGWDETSQDFAGLGQEPDGNRWNNCHYTNQFKRRAQQAREAQ